MEASLTILGGCQLPALPRTKVRGWNTGWGGVSGHESQKGLFCLCQCQEGIQARLPDRAICPLQLLGMGRSASHGRPDAPPCPAQVTLETWKLGIRAGVSLPRTWSRWHCSSAWSWTSLSWTVAAQGSHPAPGLGSTAEPEAEDEGLVRKWMLPRGVPRATLSNVASRDDGHGLCVCALSPVDGGVGHVWLLSAENVGGRPGVLILRDSNLTATRGWWCLYPTRPF